MNLNYVPSKNKDTISFNDDEWNEDISIWQSSLIGQVMGLNVKFKAMESYVQRTWRNFMHEVCLLKPGLFLIKFKNTDEMNEILCKGPWFFGSRPLLLKQWTNGEDIEKINDSVYPLWIQLPSLRLNLWNAKSISKIASAIGCPIATDRLTANRQRLAYARVLVEVKMPSPLPDKINFLDPKGKQYTQKVIYEFKPKWCEVCKQVGHDIRNCRRQIKTQRWVPKQGQNPISDDTRKEKAIIENDNSMLSNVNLNMDITRQEGSTKEGNSRKMAVHVSDTGGDGHLLSEIVNGSGRKIADPSGSGLKAMHNDVHEIKEKNTDANSADAQGIKPWTQVQKGFRSKNIIPGNSFTFLDILDIDPSTIDRGGTKDEYILLEC
ncbi:uncharacterized protein LOC109823507 [Asparagus officinalis]|uniref:uncharacterized protein LOC109823507 n=1 Tax=Asparagus officinalis TaxID=4686 RepID=UPI00098E6C95|nr:uncharacterized protein LOC109823507 [Asparagus officinalis]